MTRLERKYRETEQEVLNRLIEETTIEELEQLRLETAMDYTKIKFGEKDAKKVWNHREFWNWWRMIWHQNDIDILDWLITEQDRMNFDNYAETQLAKAVEKWLPDRRQLKRWTR